MTMEQVTTIALEMMMICRECLGTHLTMRRSRWCPLCRHELPSMRHVYENPIIKALSELLKYRIETSRTQTTADERGVMSVT